MNKNISIVINGPGMAEVKSLYGQASDWVQKALSSYDLNVKVIKGYKKEELDVTDDAWIITGSAHSVYDKFEWIEYLRSKLLEMKGSGNPVLGICFGHQLIADTFGGIVKLNSKGWELGSCNINLTNEAKGCPLFSTISSPLVAYQSHQDIVDTLPDGSILLGKNDMGIQSFVYNNQFYGVQFHPEFTKTVMDKYLEIRYDKGIIDSKPEVIESKYGSMILNNFIEKVIK